MKNRKNATVKKEGLWANINAKRKAGGKPSHGNSNAHKDAVAAGKAIKKETANTQDGKAAPFGSGYKPIKVMKLKKEDIKNLVTGLLHEMRSSMVTLGYDLESIQDVVDHLKRNYKEGIDYQLHIGRGDDLPNAISFPRGEFRDDFDLNDMLNAAQSDEDEYDAYTDNENNELAKEAGLTENVNPEVHRLINGFIRKMADDYDYSLQDAVHVIMHVLKSQNYDVVRGPKNQYGLNLGQINVNE
ncbi:hypothetical protein N9J42_00985 [bacterium]|nr:hypothetical protein [bacterium]